MDPMSIMALLSGLGSLGGMFIHDNPGKQFRRYLGDTEALLSPQALIGSANEFYKQFLGSPAYSQMQGNAIAGANTFRNSYARRVGAAGAGGSGIAHTGGALADSLYSGRLSDIQAGGFQSAMQQAVEAAKARIGAAAGIPQPSFGGPQQYGALLKSLSDWLQLYYKRGVPTAGAPPMTSPQYGWGVNSY